MIAPLSIVNWAQLYVGQIQESTTFRYNHLQGISYWNGTYELALTEKDMQVRFILKMVLECWDAEFLGTTTIFQKNNISWPQQPPTKKWLNFNMIFHDSTKEKSFSKHQNKVEFKNLDDSEVLSSDFPGPRTSAASLTSSASAASLASTASKALFHKKNPGPDGWIIPGTKITNAGPFLWNGSSKSNFSLTSDTFSVGGCWGQPLLFFWKMVVVPKNSLSQHSRTIFKPNLTCISLSVRANL